jgi:hypothetical protein
MRQMLSLEMPTDDYVVAGSGPLFARDWISDPGDIDVVARRQAWEIALQGGEATPAPFAGVRHVLLFQGAVEILDGWFHWSVDSLIEDADIIGGIRFVPLDVVATTKKLLLAIAAIDPEDATRSVRDIEHLKILAEHGVTA